MDAFRTPDERFDRQPHGIVECGGHVVHEGGGPEIARTIVDFIEATSGS